MVYLVLNQANDTTLQCGIESQFIALVIQLANYTIR